jgi:hypothetical protein
MMDSTTGQARPLVAVGYGPRCVPGNHIVAVVGSTDDEEQLQTAYRLLHQEVTVTYSDVRH